MAAPIIPSESIDYCVSLVLIWCCWSVTPLSWLYFLTSLALHQFPSLSRAFPTLSSLTTFFSDHPYLQSFFFFYTTLESLFSIYYQYLCLKVQRRNSGPDHERDFLSEVFRRTLNSGVEDEEGNRHEKDSVGYEEYQRAAREMGEVIEEIKKESDEHDRVVRNRKRAASNRHVAQAGHQEQQDYRSTAIAGEGSSAEMARGRGSTRRKRVLTGETSASPVIEIKQLRSDDPRAFEFRQTMLKWFHNAPFDSIYRENMLEWLSWACYAMTYQEVLDEHNKWLATLPNPDLVLSSDSEADELAYSARSSYRNIHSLASSDGRRTPQPRSGDSAIADDDDDEIGASKLSFLNHLASRIEIRAGQPFPQGYNPKVKPVRLTIDPIRISSRPLLLFLVVGFLQRWTLWQVWWHGFTRIKLDASEIDEDEEDGEALGGRKADGNRKGKFTYLVRVPKDWEQGKRGRKDDEETRPLVFLHGLGMGLPQYASFISHLSSDAAYRDRPIVIIEQPHISMSFFSSEYLKPLSKEATVNSLRQLVKRHGFEDGLTVLSHSNGTIVHAWFMKAVGELIKRSCFVDPVCFCLWEPDVCYNFLYSTPTSGITALMRYFVGSELGVGNTLHRNFDWSKNILWAGHSELPPELLTDPYRTFVVLAENDSILSAPRVQQYLVRQGMKEVQNGGNLWIEKGGAHGESMIAGGDGLERVMTWVRGNKITQ